MRRRDSPKGLSSKWTPGGNRQGNNTPPQQQQHSHSTSTPYVKWSHSLRGPKAPASSTTGGDRHAVHEVVEICGASTVDAVLELEEPLTNENERDSGMETQLASYVPENHENATTQVCQPGAYSVQIPNSEEVGNSALEYGDDVEAPTTTSNDNPSVALRMQELERQLAFIRNQMGRAQETSVLQLSAQVVDEDVEGELAERVRQLELQRDSLAQQLENTPIATVVQVSDAIQPSGNADGSSSSSNEEISKIRGGSSVVVLRSKKRHCSWFRGMLVVDDWDYNCGRHFFKAKFVPSRVCHHWFRV